MKKFLLAILVFYSTQTLALELRVYYLYTNLRLVISDEPCNTGQGNKASAQRLDRLFIPGCWYKMEEHPNMIHIDWANGDWSELEFKRFEKVDTVK
jgi:hypothetical protein